MNLTFARTNYFRVRDLNAFKHDLNLNGIWPTSWSASLKHGGDFLILDTSSTHSLAGAVAFFSFGPWPKTQKLSEPHCRQLKIRQDETGTYASLFEIVAAHLRDEHEIAIFMQVDADPMRSLAGYATAINATGESESLSLWDIHDLAAQNLLPPESPGGVTWAVN